MINQVSLVLLLSLIANIVVASSSIGGANILVVGSINADIIVTLPEKGFPSLGETVVAKDSDDGGRIIPGGKGANQAVSCSRLGIPTTFICNFGNDSNAEMLRSVLQENSIDTKFCFQSTQSSGLGLVFLQPNGFVSSVVVGGANAAWPSDLDPHSILKKLSSDGRQVACVLLQMEVPQHVNDCFSMAAVELGIPVFQDVGGEERDIPDEHLRRCTYISPNQSELRRLTKMPADTDKEVLAAARALQSRGARNVLVTLGDRGSLLLAETGEVVQRGIVPVSEVLDETGAGDNYRAGFVVARFAEQLSVEESMQFAAGAGAVAVTKLGAIPACATRAEVVKALANPPPRPLNSEQPSLQPTSIDISGKSEFADKMSEMTTSNSNVFIREASKSSHADDNDSDGNKRFPYKFASRLNSMKDRADLWPQGASSVESWIERQGTVEGLDLVDFNYPQHLVAPLNEPEKQRITTALTKAGLSCGAVCLRFPKEMQAGAYTHPDLVVRRRAIQLTKDACEWALALGSNEVVVWSAYCGYDYCLQADYDTLWQNVILAFQEVCDAFPNVKISLEYKPTDENTRYFAVPSTGAAVLLVKDVNRPNFGLTLDFGHCLMAGENPAQSIATIEYHRRGSLFSVQLGDGYSRLAAEDGLMFGTIHPTAALEFIMYLVKTDFQGHIYFDTFARNEDPVRECSFNIRQFKRLYLRARALLDQNTEDGKKLHEYMQNHDAMSVLELLEKY